MKPLISVILPIYNVEQYLEKCIESLRAQKYTNFEALLVDDGSTDGCGGICGRYSRIDDRFVYLHKDNGGVADARNYGLDHASGEYICFVDPDDTVTPEYLSCLYELLTENGTRISACNHWICRDGRMTENTASSDRTEVFRLSEVFERVLYHDTVDVSLWGKLYSREVFRDIRFTVGRIFEDTEFFAQIMCEGGALAYGFRPQYCYQIRSASITTGGFDERKLQYIDAAEKMCTVIEERFPELKGACLRRRVHSRISTLRFMKKCGRSEEKAQIIAYIKKHGKAVLGDRRTPAADKLAVVSLLFGEGMFHFAWTVYCRLTGRKI